MKIQFAIIVISVRQQAGCLRWDFPLKLLPMAGKVLRVRRADEGAKGGRGTKDAGRRQQLKNL